MHELMHWPMPLLEVAMTKLFKMKVFSLQRVLVAAAAPGVPGTLHHEGGPSMITNTRVSMPPRKSYGNGVEAWLDDALGATESENSLLTRILRRCSNYNLKLNP
jgi:hypothetical protein